MAGGTFISRARSNRALKLSEDKDGRAKHGGRATVQWNAKAAARSSADRWSGGADSASSVSGSIQPRDSNFSSTATSSSEADMRSAGWGCSRFSTTWAIHAVMPPCCASLVDTAAPRCACETTGETTCSTGGCDCGVCCVGGDSGGNTGRNSATNPCRSLCQRNPDFGSSTPLIISKRRMPREKMSALVETPEEGSTVEDLTGRSP